MEERQDEISSNNKLICSSLQKLEQKINIKENNSLNQNYLEEAISIQNSTESNSSHNSRCTNNSSQCSSNKCMQEINPKKKQQQNNDCNCSIQLNTNINSDSETIQNTDLIVKLDSLRNKNNSAKGRTCYICQMEYLANDIAQNFKELGLRRDSHRNVCIRYSKQCRQCLQNKAILQKQTKLLEQLDIIDQQFEQVLRGFNNFNEKNKKKDRKILGKVCKQCKFYYPDASSNFDHPTNPNSVCFLCDHSGKTLLNVKGKHLDRQRFLQRANKILSSKTCESCLVTYEQKQISSNFQEKPFDFIIINRKTKERKEYYSAKCNNCLKKDQIQQNIIKPKNLLQNGKVQAQDAPPIIPQLITDLQQNITPIKKKKKQKGNKKQEENKKQAKHYLDQQLELQDKMAGIMDESTISIYKGKSTNNDNNRITLLNASQQIGGTLDTEKKLPHQCVICLTGYPSKTFNFQQKFLPDGSFYYSQQCNKCIHKPKHNNMQVVTYLPEPQQLEPQGEGERSDNVIYSDKQPISGKMNLDQIQLEINQFQ